MDNSDHLTILIVDDDEGHRELIRRNLRRAGVTNKMIAIASGMDALNFIFGRADRADLKPDSELLVLLDVNMPGLDGTEVLRQIKAAPDKKKIPIIMLTTTDDPREIDRCYDLGCSVYITKPVDPTDFIESIRRLGMFISIVKAPVSQ